MDFEKRLEAMELMLELLDQKSSCSDLYAALSTRWCIVYHALSTRWCD